MWGWADLIALSFYICHSAPNGGAAVVAPHVSTATPRHARPRAQAQRAAPTPNPVMLPHLTPLPPLPTPTPTRSLPAPPSTHLQRFTSDLTVTPHIGLTRELRSSNWRLEVSRRASTLADAFHGTTRVSRAHTPPTSWGDPWVFFVPCNTQGEPRGVILSWHPRALPEPPARGRALFPWRARCLQAPISADLQRGDRV